MIHLCRRWTSTVRHLLAARPLPLAPRLKETTVHLVQVSLQHLDRSPVRTRTLTRSGFGWMGSQPKALLLGITRHGTKPGR